MNTKIMKAFLKQESEQLNKITHTNYDVRTFDYKRFVYAVTSFHYAGLFWEPISFVKMGKSVQPWIPVYCDPAVVEKTNKFMKAYMGALYSVKTPKRLVNLGDLS